MTIAGLPIPIPLTIGGAIGVLISSFVAFIAIVIVNAVIAHNVEAKHAFIMAILAYFVTPLVTATINLPPIIGAYIAPLIIWIALGEILLSADMKQKAEVAIIAFIVYTIMVFAGVPAVLSSMIPL